MYTNEINAKMNESENNESESNRFELSHDIGIFNLNEDNVARLVELLQNDRYFSSITIDRISFNALKLLTPLAQKNSTIGHIDIKNIDMDYQTKYIKYGACDLGIAVASILLCIIIGLPFTLIFAGALQGYARNNFKKQGLKRNILFSIGSQFVYQMVSGIFGLLTGIVLANISSEEQLSKIAENKENISLTALLPALILSLTSTIFLLSYFFGKDKIYLNQIKSLVNINQKNVRMLVEGCLNSSSGQIRYALLKGASPYSVSKNHGRSAIEVALHKQDSAMISQLTSHAEQFNDNSSIHRELKTMGFFSEKPREQLSPFSANENHSNLLQNGLNKV